jgi:hypothetical protein
VVSTGSSPGLFSQVTVTQALHMKGSGINADSNINFNMILKDDSMNAMQFSGVAYKITGFSNADPATVTVGNIQTGDNPVPHNFRNGHYVHISGIRSMSQVNFQIYEVLKVEKSSTEEVFLTLKGLNTTDLPVFDSTIENAAKINRVILSIDTRKRNEAVNVYNDYSITGAVETTGDIAFTGANSRLSFNSGANVVIPEGTTKAFDLRWSKTFKSITPSLSISDSAAIVTTSVNHKFSNGDAIMLVNNLFKGTIMPDFHGIETYIRVLSPKQFELVSVSSDYEGISGSVGHINNNVVMHITSVSSANPAVVTTSYPHDLEDNDLIIIVDVEGMTEINYRTFSIRTVINKDNTFTLNKYPEVDTTQSTTEYENYVKNGRLIKINNITHSNIYSNLYSNS